MDIRDDQPALEGLRIRWRTLEWAGASLALFLYTGAFFPLLLAAGIGLDDGARSKLRLLALPAYAITLVLLWRHRGQLGVALRRSAPMSMLVLLPLVSTVWSISGSITLRRAIALLFSVALGYVLAIRFTPRQLMAIVLALLGACMTLSLVFAIALPSLGRMPAEADASGVRGIFLHKNVLGWYAALAVLLSLIVTVERALVPRWAGLGLLSVSLACLALSSSMTGAMSLCAGLLLLGVYGLLRRMRGANRILLVLVLIQALLVVLFSLEIVLLPALDALGKDATLTGRVPLWHHVDEQITQHLLLGVGYQAFWTEANPIAWQIWTAVGWPAPHAHNGYRDMLLSFGLVGFAAFAATLVRAIWRGAILHTRAPADGWLWLNVYFGMFLTANLTESLLFVQNDFLFIIFVTAIVMYDLRETELQRALSNQPMGGGSEGLPMRWRGSQALPAR